MKAFESYGIRALARVLCALVVATSIQPAHAGEGRDETGACCLADGVCAEPVMEADCLLFGGFYQGDDSTCSEDPCPIGACCLPDGSCVEQIEMSCVAAGGEYQGASIECLFATCPPPVGACCLEDGSCQALTREECADTGGWYQGDQTSCAPAMCAGPCCLPTGDCTDGSPLDCAAEGGSFQGFGSVCAATFCGTGACCRADGTCLDLTVFDCDEIGDTFHLGADSSCAETEIQEGHYSFSLFSPNADQLTFDGFDDRAGTRVLERVTAVFEGTATAEVTVENLSPDLILADPFVTIEAHLTAAPPSGDPLRLDFENTFAAPPGTRLEPDDGTPGGGPDFYDFGELTMTGRRITTLTDPDDLDAFVGAGSIQTIVSGEGTVTPKGTQIPVAWTIGPFFAAGSCKLVYEFEDLCREDVDGSGFVGFLDVLAILSAWGPCPACCAEDVDCSGVVGFNDLLAVLEAWGACPG